MRSLPIIIAATTLVIAASLYFVVNKETPGATSMPASESQLGSVESMVGGLEQRLQQTPDDGKGWLLLAKSYRHMGHLDEARDAYKKAEALGNGDAAVAAQLYGLENPEASQ